MNIKRIFLDVDDVLAEFTLSALKYVGCPITGDDYSIYNPEWGFNIIKAANALHQKRVFTAASFWKEIPRVLWAGLRKTKECDWLISASAELVGRKNVILLTSPTEDPDCAAGKIEWIQDFMPVWLHRQFLIGPPKWACAAPGSLLIDDSDANVNAFRKASGIAALLPRPWNSDHDKQHEEFLMFSKVE